MVNHDRYQYITVVTVTDKITQQQQTVEISYKLQNHNQYSLTVNRSPVDGKIHQQVSSYQQSTSIELTKQLLDQAIKALPNFQHLSPFERERLQNNTAFRFLTKCFGVKI